MENCNHAFKYAIKLLSKRDYSKQRLLEKLVERDFATEEILETMQSLLEKNYLREDLYIEARIKGLGRKGYSPRYIAARLKEEKIAVSTDTIEAILCESEISSESEIRRLILKKLPRTAMPVDKFKIRLKIENFLRSKGHSREDYYDILSQTLKEELEITPCDMD